MFSHPGAIAWLMFGFIAFMAVYSSSRPWEHHPKFQVMFALVLILVGPLALLLVFVPAPVVQAKATAIRAWLDRRSSVQ